MCRNVRRNKGKPINVIKKIEKIMTEVIKEMYAFEDANYKEMTDNNKLKDNSKIEVERDFIKEFISDSSDDSNIVEYIPNSEEEELMRRADEYFKKS